MARFDIAVADAALRVYQLTLSPVLYAFGVRCRHHPTCSSYARDCVRRFGAWPGAWMALARLARCRPGGTEGADPAPTTAPSGARWFKPWTYGDWRGPRDAAAPPRSDSDERDDHAGAHLS